VTWERFLKTDRLFSTFTLLFQAPLLLAGASLLVFLASGAARAFGASDEGAAGFGSRAPITGAIYETSFRKSNVEIFSPDGVFLGLVGKVPRPTGITFDSAGNLFISSDNRKTGYSIIEITVDGLVSTFANTGLGGPHGLVFDQAGNLYVANTNGNSIEKFTPDGIGAVFADATDGLDHPIALAFDSAGNLFVTNSRGGVGGGGKVLKLTAEGIVSVFADTGFQTAYGLAFDTAENVYVSNNTGDTVERFALDGTDLGVFCSTSLYGPLGIIFDSAGNLYVANANNATIEKFAPDGTDLGVFAMTRGGPHFLAIYESQ
jgi:DNA-binding beta-propeller fold protein YncE